MRPLSGRQAVTCETAKTKRCKCRCGGLLHGKGRFSEAGDAVDLPADDPHAARKVQLTLFDRADLQAGADRNGLANADRTGPG